MKVTGRSQNHGIGRGNLFTFLLLPSPTLRPPQRGTTLLTMTGSKGRSARASEPGREAEDVSGRTKNLVLPLLTSNGAMTSEAV